MGFVESVARLELVLSLAALCVGGCGRIGFERSDGGPADMEPVDMEPADAGPNSLTVVDTGEFPFRLAVDADHLYWAEFERGSVHRVPLAGGPSVELIPPRPAGQAEVYGLLLFGDDVYICDSATGEIRRVPAAGGTVDRVAVSPCFDLASDGTHLYWTSISPTEPALRRLALPDGPVEDFGAPGPSRHVMIRDSEIYWTDYASGQVASHPTSQGPTRVLTTRPPRGPWGLEVDDTHVYWAEPRSPDGSIARVSRAGGSVEVLATGQPGAHSVVGDGTELYWTNELAGEIMQLSVGGAPTLLVGGLGEPQNLVLTPTALFWSTRAGQVMRLRL